jgi:hypothetical protein
MAVEAPFPELDEFLLAIGEAGHRLSEIEAIEGAAGKSVGGVSWRTNAAGTVAHRTTSSMRRR